MERTLVIGSNSFTGSHFVDHLLENNSSNVVGISRSSEYSPVFLPYLQKKERSGRYVFHQLDLNRDMAGICALCDDFKPDLVVNFAAQGEVRNSWKWPEQWYETNCLATVRLVAHLQKQDYLERYVAISTPEVYGSTGTNVKENHNYRPSTPYGGSKLAADLHLLSLYRQNGFPAVFTRAANVYGRHQQLYRIIPRTIIYLKLGRKIQLHGHGLAQRAFIHVRDVANCTLRVASKGVPGDIYHIAPSDGTRSIADVVKYICELMGCEFEDSVELVDENFGQDALFSMDCSKARNELGWADDVSFETGVKETIEWIEKNWDFIQKQPLDYVHKR